MYEQDEAEEETQEEEQEQPTHDEAITQETITQDDEPNRQLLNKILNSVSCVL